MNQITIKGKIHFEPIDLTKKHKKQANWKRMAMVHLDGDITEYYAWFIQKRYNLVLNKPLRGAHISFINDSIKDLSINDTKTMEEIDATWNAVKAKWDNQIIPITLDLSPRTDDKHWWLNIKHEDRELLHGIRAELGLGKPFWGLHMSIGYARPGLNEIHSKYIHNLIKKRFINE
jgi:hypothetical protein